MLTTMGIRNWDDRAPEPFWDGVAMVQGSSKSNSTLNSWKEIATFLNRGVRTVQRWERELGLPVRRVRTTEHSPVFAYPKELEVWLNSRPAVASQRPASQRGQLRLRHSDMQGLAEETVRRSQHLVRELGSLVIEQRSRAETLNATVNATVAGMKDRRKRQGNYDSERTSNKRR